MKKTKSQIKEECTRAFAKLNRRIYELESGSTSSFIGSTNHLSIIDPIEAIAFKYPEYCLPLLNDARIRLDKAYTQFKSKVDMGDYVYLKQIGDWGNLTLSMFDEATDYDFKLKSLIEAISKLVHPELAKPEDAKLKESSNTNNQEDDKLTTVGIKTFTWIGAVQVLKALFTNLNGTIFETNEETFNTAFSGKEITDPLKIRWLLNVKNQKEVVPEIISIFHLLAKLKEMKLLKTSFNFYVHTNNNRKVSAEIYNQIASIFILSDKSTIINTKLRKKKLTKTPSDNKTLITQLLEKAINF